MKANGKSIKCESYARVGFLGNPSDAYYGNTIAIAIRNFGASVTLEPSDALVFRPHPVHDPAQFASLQHLVRFLLHLGVDCVGISFQQLREPILKATLSLIPPFDRGHVNFFQINALWKRITLKAGF